MRNPEITRQIILSKAAFLFNTKGYSNTSISDITNSTGFTKGAIYKHFQNKEMLEKEAFDFLVLRVLSFLGKKIKEKNNAYEKLICIFDFFEDYINNNTFPGGCPILNISTEIDDVNSSLKIQVLSYVDMFIDAIIKILNNGIRHNQIKPEVNTMELASMIFASIEGGLMLSKLKQNVKDTKTVGHFLENYLKTILI